MQLFSVLKNLLPQGAFWEVTPHSAFHRLLLALSDELDRNLEVVLNIPNILSYDQDPSRFMKYLGLNQSLLKSKDSQIQAILSILSRQGNLSRQYIEERLKALGYTHFSIDDPTEEDAGLEPIVKDMISVYKRIESIHYLSAGDPCGSSLQSWWNLPFELDVKKLLPAYIAVNFLYQENINASNI